MDLHTKKVCTITIPARKKKEVNWSTFGTMVFYEHLFLIFYLNYSPNWWTHDAHVKSYFMILAMNYPHHV